MSLIHPVTVAAHVHVLPVLPVVGKLVQYCGTGSIKYFVGSCEPATDSL